MSVQSYLADRASAAILSDTEKASIERSISTLEVRLRVWFENELQKQFLFGSYTRGTILPRIMDAHSDVDYMVVFKDGTLKPQTYISKLKKFAEVYYSSSEIAQSHPTVVLSLGHIKFELVPAITSYLAEYQIPALSSSYADWMSTNPNAFNTELSTANKNVGYNLKPAVRLLKFWNAKTGYPFESYWLETWAAGRWYSSASTVKDILFSCVENLPSSYYNPQWKKDRIERAKKIVADTRALDNSGYPISAELEVKKLIPAA